MPVTSARVAFSLALSLIALLPSPSLQDRTRSSDGFFERYETPVSSLSGQSKWNENNDFSGSPSYNKWETNGRESSSSRSSPGLTSGSSSGLIGKRPSSRNKVNTESSSEGNYPHNYSNNDRSTQRSHSDYERESSDGSYNVAYTTTHRSTDRVSDDRYRGGSDGSYNIAYSTTHRSSERVADDRYRGGSDGSYNVAYTTTHRSSERVADDRYRESSDGSYNVAHTSTHRSSDRVSDDGYRKDSDSSYNVAHTSTHWSSDRVSNDRNEDSQSQQCRDNEFHCGSNECLSRSVKCDSRVDCRDGSDEASCAANRNQDNSCVLPEQPEGGHYVLTDCERCTKRPGDIVPKKSILNYTCNSNYILSGNTISVCVDSQWYQPPSCLKVCPPLNSTTVNISCSYQGEAVSCSERIMPGTRATLACKSSYKLPLTNDPAYREITCLDDGLWDRRLFRCLPECGTSVARGNTLIVNGFQAKAGIFPWHIGIYSKQRTSEYQQICGGALVSNNLVVSAAHCFYDEVYNKLYDASKYIVAAGKHYRDWYAREDYAQQSSVESIQAGGRYQGARGNFADDIALLKLKTPFELTTFVRPVCVDWDNTYEREQLQVGRAGKVVGWGKDIKGESTRSLQEIDMPFVPYDQCLSAVPVDFRGFLTSDKFCAGHLNGSSVCDGDSGGGLCFEKDGVWYLRGIVSVGPENRGSCDYNSYVGFTDVSHFRDWIREAYVNS